MIETPVLRIGVVKYASCDGCQLTILDLEDELLAIGERFEIAEFPEASSLRSTGPFDVLLVEGSVSAPDQAREIKELREVTKTLVTIGSCANFGGIQALRNFGKEADYRAAVYAHPEYIESLEKALPVREYVTVDYELAGCPINPRQLRELFVAVRLGRRPQIRQEAVCAECKRAGFACVLVSRGEPCLGPATQAGCGALCIHWNRGCFGCYGPRQDGNPDGLVRIFQGHGSDDESVGRLFAGFAAGTEPFGSIVRRMSGGTDEEAL
jgi:coenzyme F420-reducing hydrogenase gamma subunit